MKLRSLLFLSISISCTAQTTVPSGPLNNVRVIQLVQGGLGQEDLARIILTAPRVDFNLTPAFTNQLLQYGVSEDTIKLMAAREGGIAPAPTTGQSQTPATPVVTLPPRFGDKAPAKPQESPLPDDAGVYFMDTAGEWTEIEPEIVNWKTGGVVKSLVTDHIIKGDVNGHVRGGQSRTRIRSNEILVVALEGVSITEYQLLRMRQHAESREFRAVTGGIFHESGGADRDILDFDHKKIAKRTFLVTLPASLGDGNYGLLPPGAFASRSATSIGKIYTFRIVN